MTIVIGPADDFYRLRVSRLDLGDGVDLDWRDDVLWRRSPESVPSEEDAWVVEAVTLDAKETATPIAEFGSADEAQVALDEIRTDLNSMTKAEFEAEYLGSRALEG